MKKITFFLFVPHKKSAIFFQKFFNYMHHKKVRPSQNIKCIVHKAKFNWKKQTK